MSLSNLIDIATDEKQTEDDWTKILDVCESGTTNPKECLKLILKKIFNRNPHVVLRSLILLDACVQNIGETFAKEISSRFFVAEIKSKSKSLHHKALARLCFMIKKWSREFSGAEFDFITELNKWLQDTYPSLYAAGDDELNSRNAGKSARKVVAGQEEADIAKAIALSLKESETKRSTLYPATVNNVVNETTQPKKSMTKVRALYDFEAAEENELTFKAGEIIIEVDTSNEHWWTGSNHRGSGMFPAQFVTVDIDGNQERPSEQTHKYNDKSVSQVNQQPDSYVARPPTPVIDESRINDCIRLIEDADPTGEQRPDPAELAKCEAQCRLMGPLIDQELEKVDRHYNRLVEINGKIISSFQMYNELMTQGGMMSRPTNYIWQSHMAPPVQYMNVHHDPSSQMMPPQGPSMPHGIAHQMHSIPQQPMPLDASRFQSMNYYAGPDYMPNHEIRNSQVPTNVNHSMPSATYPLPAHMSMDKDRQHNIPQPGSSNNSALVVASEPLQSQYEHTEPGASNIMSYSVHGYTYSQSTAAVLEHSGQSFIHQ